MPISVQCPQCGFSRAVPEEFAGRLGKSSQSGAVVKLLPKQQSDDLSTGADGEWRS